MRIITVGGTGFLGRHVAQAFGEAGHENLLLTRHKAGLEDLQLIDQSRPTQSDRTGRTPRTANREGRQ